MMCHSHFPEVLMHLECRNPGMFIGETATGSTTALGKPQITAPGKENHGRQERWCAQPCLAGGFTAMVRAPHARARQSHKSPHAGAEECCSLRTFPPWHTLTLAKAFILHGLQWCQQYWVANIYPVCVEIKKPSRKLQSRAPWEAFANRANLERHLMRGEQTLIQPKVQNTHFH